MVAHDNIGDVPPPADENADLTVDAVGQLREGAGEFMGEDAVRRDAPSIEPLDGFDVFRPQAGGVAEDFVYSNLLFRLRAKGSRLKERGCYGCFERAMMSFANIFDISVQRDSISLKVSLSK